MKLQTNIPITAQRYNTISYHSKLFSMGSCFAEHIGAKLSYFKFQSLVNPFGVLFHPLAIETCITNAINKKTYRANDLFFHMERYHSFDVHSDMSDSDPEAMLERLNQSVIKTHDYLKSASHILMTLGTAWVYRYIETDTYVANCHKIPQKKFLKELLSSEQILESLEAILSLVKSINPDAQFIFTVSPVRHLKDGFVENTRSKSHLISAIHEFVEQHSRDCHYFPSYEIMMDELRDYRFYREDMLHPNITAIDYIWERFQTAWMSSDSLSTMQTIDDIQKGLQHRAFNPSSEAHLKFLERLEESKNAVREKFGHIKF